MSVRSFLSPRTSRSRNIGTYAFTETRKTLLCNIIVIFAENVSFRSYCKTLNISVPLMLAKLAMRYHSLTFVDAKINVYRYACAVVCHVVSKAENGVLHVQLVAGKQLSLLLPSCDNPCSTSAGNRSIEQVRAKERRKRGKYNHHDA